jgi:hypothetical protein
MCALINTAELLFRVTVSFVMRREIGAVTATVAATITPFSQKFGSHYPKTLWIEIKIFTFLKGFSGV